MSCIHDLSRPVMPQRDDFFGVETTAKALAVTAESVLVLIRDGVLDAYRVPDFNGGAWIVSAQSVLNFMNTKRTALPGRPLRYVPAIGKKPWGRFGLRIPSQDPQLQLPCNNMSDSDLAGCVHQFQQNVAIVLVK